MQRFAKPCYFRVELVRLQYSPPKKDLTSTKKRSKMYK